MDRFGSGTTQCFGTASGGLPLLPGRDELPAMHDPHGRKTTRACEISTEVAFNVWGTANASAPQESREKALQQYDTLQNIHKALQWWSFGRKINPTSRVSVLTENRSNGLKIFRMIYESEFMD